MMLTGLTVANVVGVPLTTLIGQHLGWQWPYALVWVIAVGTVVALWCWVRKHRSFGSAFRTISTSPLTLTGTNVPRA